MNGRTGDHRDELRTLARQAMIEHDLLPDFSAEAMDQLGGTRNAAMGRTKEIRDLTGLLWASIDNDDSRDLDQLTVAEPLSGGRVKILVAIADVDALVKKESAVDHHAAHNTTSIYTAAEIFPMLPEQLSTDLTSLTAGKDRLAIIVEMVLSEDGELISSNLFRAIVNNHAKLAYNSVAAWLEGTGACPRTDSDRRGVG